MYHNKSHLRSVFLVLVGSLFSGQRRGAFSGRYGYSGQCTSQSQNADAQFWLKTSRAGSYLVIAFHFATSFETQAEFVCKTEQPIQCIQ